MQHIQIVVKLRSCLDELYRFLISEHFINLSENE